MKLKIELLNTLKAIPPEFISLPTGGAEITAVEHITAEQGGERTGEFYRVSGAIHPVDTAAPDILFQAGLPMEWSGKLLQYGGGGIDGFVLPVEMPCAGRSMTDRTPLAEGYVVFNSDSGHQMDFTNPWDCRWALNDEALENFAHAQLKKTRDVVCWLAVQCYGTALERVYFVGGSNGGRECMKAIQHYPESYDGAICFYPVLYWVSKVLADNRNGNKLEQLGQEAWIDAETYAKVQACIMKHCDALDGLEDGLISNLTAAATKRDAIRAELQTLLNPKQFELIEEYTKPMTTSFPLGYGEVSLPGYAVYEGAALVDDKFSMLGSSAFARDGSSVGGADAVISCMVLRDPDADMKHFDPEQWPQELQKASRLLDAYSTDLDDFSACGGKLLLVQGTTDALVTVHGTTAYYEQLQERYGKALKEFLRFYLVPGYGHGGGDFVLRADLLTALDRWVEEDARPEGLVAEDQGDQVSHRCRPLCEYPLYPAYNGAGDPSQAESFVQKSLKA